LVIDHLGRIDPAQGPAAEAYGVVLGLLDGGNTWVKLSGAYMRSTVHGPSYADTLPLGQALVQAAPERLVWGSDWPHTTETPGTVNDADLVDLLRPGLAAMPPWTASWSTTRRGCMVSIPPPPLERVI